MEKEPLVSIKCLTYNHEPYIRQCLDGFVMQKTNFKFEAIVHDDASTDKTADIIREYAEKYPDIIKPIYETENQYSKHDGSLNRIMNAHMRGKYIAFCEGDDYWIDPLKLQKQVDFLEANPDYSASTHQSIIIGESKRAGKLFLKTVPSCITMNDVISNSRLFHTASIVCRSTVKELPQFKGCILSGDKLLILKCAYLGKIDFLNESMCVYRKHAEGASNTVTLGMIKQDLCIIPYMKSIYPVFPKYRYLSFLYGTFATYPSDIGKIQQLKYLLLSFLCSFSFFPENLIVLTKKLINYYAR